MIRSCCIAAVGALLVLTGCSSRLTDVPTDRPPAVVDYSTMSSREGVDHYTVRQWRTSLTLRLQAALDLPDREFRPNQGACASSSGSTTALYPLDARSRAVRVLAPTDDPCQQIRHDVMVLLPPQDTPAELTFRASRKAS